MAFVCSDITIRSRNESIGGLVTCANCWRKKSKGDRTVCDSTGIGVSSPIEPTASCSAFANTVMTSFNSSRERLNIF